MFYIVNATYKLATGPHYQFLSLKRLTAAEREVYVYDYIENARNRKLYHYSLKKRGATTVLMLVLVSTGY